MRRFLILGHTQQAVPPLPLDDLAGAAGRWDLLARVVANALLVSHGVRQDTQVLLLLGGRGGPRCVRIDGGAIRRLNPDERSTAALLSKALEARDVAAYEDEPVPGVHVSARSLEQAMDLVPGALVLLREDAMAELHEWRPPAGDVTFVLSDHRDPTPEEERLVRSRRPIELTLGPVSLQADQCVAVVHNHLDRAAARRTGGS